MRKEKRLQLETVVDAGDYLKVDVSTKKNQSATMLIDKDDWESIQKMGAGVVSAVKSKNSNYPYARTVINGRSHLIHKLIIATGKDIDHINRNGLDNRKENLRECTHEENMRNQGLRSNNTSGYRGVSKQDGSERWIARITCNFKTHHIGVFDSKEDAAIEYARHARLLFGEFHNKQIKD